MKLFRFREYALIRANHACPSLINIRSATEILHPTGAFPLSLKHSPPHAFLHIIFGQFRQAHAFALVAPIANFSSVRRRQITFFSRTDADFFPNPAFGQATFLILGNSEFVSRDVTANLIAPLGKIRMKISTVNSPSDDKKNKKRQDRNENNFYSFFQFFNLFPI